MSILSRIPVPAAVHNRFVACLSRTQASCWDRAKRFLREKVSPNETREEDFRRTPRTQELRPGGGSSVDRWRCERVTSEQADDGAAAQLKPSFDISPWILLHPQRSRW